MNNKKSKFETRFSNKSANKKDLDLELKDIRDINKKYSEADKCKTN